MESATKTIKTLFALFFRLKGRFPLAFFIVRRIAAMFVMLLVFSLSLFLLLDILPGQDIIGIVMATRAPDTSDLPPDIAAQIQADLADRWRRRLGLDRPFYVQYARWAQGALRGDFGVGLVSRAPVGFLMRERFLNTLFLNIISLSTITLASVLLGSLLARRAGGRMDLAANFAALALYSLPPLMVCILLQILAFMTGLFPITGFPRFSFASAPGAFVPAYIHHVFLLVMVHFAQGFGEGMRETRALVLDQISRPYMLSLRMRGISERRALFSHAFRNCLTQTFTRVGLTLTGIFGSSLVMEIIFAFPGSGRLMYEAMIMRDVNLVLSIFVFISVFLMVTFTIVDILIAAFDPRVRYG